MDKKIVEYTTNHDLSDIHVRSSEAFAIRVHGNIQMFHDDVISEETIIQFLKTVLSEDEYNTFISENDLDVAMVLDGIRFRGNLYRTQRGPAFVLRKINDNIPQLDKLNLPPVVEDILEKPNGLILVTGPTGSGKSTSLAAMVNKLNETKPLHIITIEHPIEFIHESKMSLISQREVGRHTHSFASALRGAMREDPDVILVGELRDRETVSLALTAAETGHLVLGTLHTSGAANTINRIIDVFSAEQQDQIRTQVSQSLQLVMTQQLLPNREGDGRVGAYEVMVCNNAVRNLIRENKIPQITSIMQTAVGEGMMTMERSLEKLATEGSIRYGF